MTDITENNIEVGGSSNTPIMADAEVSVKKSKVDKVGLSVYGPTFTKFDLLVDIKDLIPLFKQFYYDQKWHDFKTPMAKMLRQFNKDTVYPAHRTFFPYLKVVKRWTVKWDVDLYKQMGNLENPKELVVVDKDTLQLVQTRDGHKHFVAPADTDIEKGVRTLTGDLLNDAAQMLQDDRAMEDSFTPADLIKRRSYILNVLNIASRSNQGNAAIALKKTQEKRENAGFLMELLAKATAGTLTDDQMSVLEQTCPVPIKGEAVSEANV